MYFCTYMGVYITDSVNMNLSKLWEAVEDREAWHAAVRGFPKNRPDRLSDWATSKGSELVSLHMKDMPSGRTACSPALGGTVFSQSGRSQCQSIRNIQREQI